MHGRKNEYDPSFWVMGTLVIVWDDSETML